MRCFFNIDTEFHFEQRMISRDQDIGLPRNSEINKYLIIRVSAQRCFSVG